MENSSKTFEGFCVEAKNPLNPVAWPSMTATFAARLEVPRECDQFWSMRKSVAFTVCCGKLVKLNLPDTVG